MTSLARVLFDESHNSAWTIRPEVAQTINPQNPADSSYVAATQLGSSAGFDFTANPSTPLTQKMLAEYDIVVLPHGAEDSWDKTVKSGSPKFSTEEIDALVDFVETGGGLLILGETEFQKYGNNHHELAQRFGVKFLNATIQDSVNNHNDVATWIKPVMATNSNVNLFARVKEFILYRAGALEASSEDATVIARSHMDADPANSGVMATVAHGAGRVVVLMDSDLFGDDSIQDADNAKLLINILSWLCPRDGESSATSMDFAAVTSPDWKTLVASCEALRPLQNKDGSIDNVDDRHSIAISQVKEIQSAISGLLEYFPHQLDHLNQTVIDFDKWIDSGFAVPDFYDSLMLFAPEKHRVNNTKNLVVFPMYTQNGNPNRNFEAVITNTFWPDWLAQLEHDKYNNPAFVPIEFVGFTKGYDTHSAVLFPETVATRETAVFTWGGIFCDRESARFQRISSESVELLKVKLPPEAKLLLQRQSLAQETFVLWDLIHDRAHSHGDLPFDPFMIKQRMPFWMYALEELRCDLNTYRETLSLEKEGVYLGAYIRHAILFDRLFRFPITGDRVRNYDGLGGQVLFAWLHQKSVMRWTDNVLSINWDEIDDCVVGLCEEVEKLYREGIDRSRISQWLTSYEFVSSLVEPHPASMWAKGVEALPINGELKELTNAVLDDEFPLNVFYEALKKKLQPTIDSIQGITK